MALGIACNSWRWVGLARKLASERIGCRHNRRQTPYTKGAVRELEPKSESEGWTTRLPCSILSSYKRVTNGEANLQLIEAAACASSVRCPRNQIPDTVPEAQVEAAQAGCRHSQPIIGDTELVVVESQA